MTTKDWISETAHAGYDIVGDIHGCADSLIELIDLLGYVKRGGVYTYRDQHKPRQLLFVGDLLDRGPKIRETALLVHDMVERGVAQMVMGNHEYSAIGYCTKAPVGMGREYLRDHTARHERQIRETLEQFDAHPGDWRDVLSWIKHVPLFLEFEAFRVVHACWDHAMIEQFVERYQSNCIDEGFIVDSFSQYAFPAQCIDRLLRGVDLPLPDGEKMLGRDGYTRSKFRVGYWHEAYETYDDLAFQPDPLPEHIANRSVSEEHRSLLPHYGRQEKPLFFGHYWRRGIPKLVTDNLACLDYSAVNRGHLVAYRMDGQALLDERNFCSVAVN